MAKIQKTGIGKEQKSLTLPASLVKYILMLMLVYVLPIIFNMSMIAYAVIMFLLFTDHSMKDWTESLVEYAKSMKNEGELNG